MLRCGPGRAEPWLCSAARRNASRRVPPEPLPPLPAHIPPGAHRGATLFALAFTAGAAIAQHGHPPATANVVVILADDLGYADLGAYGGTGIATPNLDRLAREGIRFTDFYASAPVCTPTRNDLLTGRHAVRTGMSNNTTGVLQPQHQGGLPAGEVTLAELLRGEGYSTACIGKWHLGHQPEHLPTQHGFDYFYGVPYSNNMTPLPLLRNTTLLGDANAAQSTLTQLFTQEAIAFVERERNGPFFLYFAPTAPHVPLHPSPEFAGQSGAGTYGDVVQELDHSVGRILDALATRGIERHTVVVFTSDNGPDRINGGGSATPFRGAKSTVYEGGVRVPCIVRWTDRIAGEQVSGALCNTLDLFPTVAAIAGAPLPDVALDGIDLGAVWLQGAASARDFHPYYHGKFLIAGRIGDYKLHLRTQLTSWAPSTPLPAPLLFDLRADPGEQIDIAATHQTVVAEILARVRSYEETVEFGITQF